MMQEATKESVGGGMPPIRAVFIKEQHHV